MKKSNTLRNFWYRLSANQRFFIRKLYYFPIDLFDSITGRTNKYVPPRGSIYTGSPASAKDYLRQGEHQLDILIEDLHLRPNDTILDIGSGVGRTAIALSSYLNNNAEYHGFDVVKRGVDWCNNGLGRDYPNFKFKYVPIFNHLYNKSELKATEFRFPYEDGVFDKVFSFSLFTHMQIEEIEHYFTEIYRVLKKDGMALSTFFLYDDSTEKYIANLPDFAFPHKKDNFRLMNANVESGNIAIHKDKLYKMLAQANLKCLSLIDGYWKNTVIDNLPKKEYQDIVVFKRNQHEI